MHNRALHDTLAAFVEEAAWQLAEEVAAGAEIPFELIEQGRIEPHPVFPDKAGPAARRIETEADVGDAIELLRLNYDRVVARHGLPS